MCIKFGKNVPLILAQLLVIWVVCSIHANAQNSCIQTLKEATKNYEQGHLSVIPDKLKNCMSGDFSKSEMIQAYRLLILTYLFLDEQENASETMNDLLVYEPDYRPNKELDPVEYINLFKSYRVEPFLSFGVQIGANRTSPKVINDFSVGNTEANPTIYTPGISINAGVCADVQIYKSLSVTLEGIIVNRAYNSNAPIFINSEVVSNESQFWVDAPLTFKYTIGKGKLKPYLRAGAALNIILLNNATLVRRVAGTTQNEYTGSEVSLTAQRNTLNISAVFGAGLTYKLGYGFLFLDARYNLGFSNIVKKDSRYDFLNNQVFNYGFIDSDLSIESIQVSVGYMYSFYKVHKKKTKQVID